MRNKKQLERDIHSQCEMFLNSFIEIVTSKVADKIINELSNPSSLTHIPSHYTISEVCEKLHISKPTFHNHVNAGLIKTVKIGRRTLIEAKEIDRLLLSIENKSE